METASLIARFAGILLFLYLIEKIWRSRNGNRFPLPPGPKGLPLIGNLNDLPKHGVLEAKHWLKHKDLYGPISSVTVMGQTMIIINDANTAFEILEKRSVKHSSRPRTVFSGEMVGWEHATGGTKYNERFRTHRKNMSRIIGSKTTAAQYNKMQEAEVGRLLLHLLDKPDDLVDHIKREAGSLILKIVYGYTAEPFKTDPLVHMIEKAMDNFAKSATPGAFLVDVFPFLRHVPSWFPGTRFKQTAKKWRAELLETTEKPYAFVESQLAQGKDNSSFLSHLIESEDCTAEEKFNGKWSALALYAGGADTTVSSISFFFLAMAIFPDVQRKAQQEIDQVIGCGRLPTITDRENLPYVEAVVKEVMRWHSIVPMGLPHCSTEDDVYGGYFIPKDAMLFANIWHFTHDPAVYADPMAFKPDRFLPSEGREAETDPHRYVFGFGRRICPGRILADNSLFLNISQALAVYSITKPIVNGKETEPTVKFTSGVISRPEPFQTSIKPRSPQHEQLIRSIEKAFPWEESDSKLLA